MTEEIREKHLKRCKKMSLEYLHRHDLINAITSMLSNLSQHPENKNISPFIANLGYLYAQKGDKEAIERWIEGFN